MSDQTIYRCGWCGNATDQDGHPLGRKELKQASALHQKYGEEIVEEIHGLCCKEEAEMARAERLWNMITNR